MRNNSFFVILLRFHQQKQVKAYAVDCGFWKGCFVKKSKFSRCFFAFILLRQLVGHFLIEKLIFSFCFFNIPDQQSSRKKFARFGKCITCPHEGRCGFGAGPTMVDGQGWLLRRWIPHRSLWYFFLRRKRRICATIRNVVSDQYLLVSAFYRNHLRFLLSGHFLK